MIKTPHRGFKNPVRRVLLHADVSLGGILSLAMGVKYTHHGYLAVKGLYN